MSNKKKKPPTVIIRDFKAMREVDFFLRLHGHLPDDKCGASPLASCNYREDGIAINRANEPLIELRENPEFVQKEKEVQEAVKLYWDNKK